MGSAYLLIERGIGAGSRIELTQFPVTIGRDPSNQVIIKDNEASRFHLRLKKRGRLFILEDLESRNGTYVNGDKIINSTIANGDKILIGSTELTFLAADSGINIVTSVMTSALDFDADSGIEGPISIDTLHKHNLRQAIRLDPITLANNILVNPLAINEIFNYHSNMIVTRDLKESCKILLKSIGKLAKRTSRAALFIWSERDRQLIPYAIKNFTDHPGQGFLVSKGIFEDVLSRKQTIILGSNIYSTLFEGRNRAVLPMMSGDELIAIIHLESDDPNANFLIQELETVQALLLRAAPVIESMLLRHELDSWLYGILDTVMSTIEAKDTYTRGHSERVSSYSAAIADELKLNKDTKRHLMISSLCHDIGKIGIPDAILKKASMLSSEEYSEIKLHPAIGSSIISHLPNAQRIISGVKYHHEKWDGTGYPEGLSGEDIPFFGRIIGLSDVFDAMVSGRSYAGFIDQEEAIERLTTEAELFDPEILKAFLRACEKGKISLKTSTQNIEAKGEFMDQNEDTKFNPS